MYVPELYRPPNPAWEIELVRAYPLALLVTNGVDGPTASNVPVILEREPIGAEQQAGMTGLTLVGHMNRENPQWTELARGGRALLVFSGPHSYVTPTLYARTPAAPTWNFTAVQLHGTVRPLPAGPETIRVIQDTVLRFEERFGSDWDMSSSLGYFQQIVPGVGAFRLIPDSVQSMFKLSQEQRPEVRARVCTAFARDDSTRHRRLADLMDEIRGVRRRPSAGEKES
jgi:transcriptional regulator